MKPEKHAASDVTGLETLELFSHAKAFNRWMFDVIRPYCGGSVLEIGSGIGNISSLLLEQFDDLTLSDLRSEYCALLRDRFQGCPGMKGVVRLDLAVENLADRCPELIGRFNSVIALNVVEHIAEHGRAVQNARALLKQGGRLIILVPAYKWLYNPIDKQLGHFRRYTRKTLAGLVEAEGLRVLHQEYFNAAAIPGWWVTGTLFRIDRIKATPLQLYEKMVPMMQLVDRLVGKRVGLSVVTVAER